MLYISYHRLTLLDFSHSAEPLFSDFIDQSRLQNLSIQSPLLSQRFEEKIEESRREMGLARELP